MTDDEIDGARAEMALRLSEGLGAMALARIAAALAREGWVPPPDDQLCKKQELNSLLLVYESHVLALYTYQSADPDPDDFLDIDRDKSIAKRKAAIEKVREMILAYAEED